MTDALTQRKTRMIQLQNNLESLGETDFNKFLSMMELKFGMSRKTLLEYIRTLKGAGILTVDEGKISMTKLTK